VNSTSPVIGSRCVGRDYADFRYRPTNPRPPAGRPGQHQRRHHTHNTRQDDPSHPDLPSIHGSIRIKSLRPIVRLAQEGAGKLRRKVRRAFQCPLKLHGCQQIERKLRDPFREEPSGVALIVKQTPGP